MTVTKTKKKKKIARHMQTKQGFPVKVLINQTTGGILPSNWKQQANYLSNNATIKREGARG
jgi:hypothetical protein